MTEPAGRGVRIAALVLFVALPIGLLGTTAASLLGWRETSDVILRQEALLAQLDARLARLGNGPAGLGDTSSIYLPGDSEALASAALQTRLVQAAETAGGRVIETQAVETAEPDAEDDARLRITLDVGTEGLFAFLTDVEAGLPLLAVEKLAVRQLPVQEAADPEDPMLRVDITVRGAFRRPTG